MTLTFDIYKSSFRWLHISTLNATGYNSFTYIQLCPFPYKSLSDLTWPCHKNWSGSTKGHSLKKFGRARVPNNAYQVSRSLAIRFIKRRFFKVFTYLGMAATLIMWLRSYEETFIPLSNKGSTCNLVSISPAVLEEKIKILNLRHPGQRLINYLDLWYL